MHVTVVLPTYKTRRTIFKLLNSLKRQSYKNFSIMLIYKEWSGYKDIFNEIMEYKDLDVDFVKQDDGFFEEAMNTAYRKADGNIVLHIDDDAYVSSNWIQDHVDFHSKHTDIGIATGIVDESSSPDGKPLPKLTMMLNNQKWRMNKHTLLDRPIDKKFKGYGMYIGKSGMLVDTGKKYDMIKTFKQYGVNMSWKKDALHDFKLLGYTKNGVRNEAAAALEVMRRGFDAVWFNGGAVYHPAQESYLSRGASISSVPIELTAESVLFAYYTSYFYEVDTSILRTRAFLDNIATSAITLNKNHGYKIGYKIAKCAIDEHWQPSRVRTALINALRLKM